MEPSGDPVPLLYDHIDLEGQEVLAPSSFLNSYGHEFFPVHVPKDIAMSPEVLCKKIGTAQRERKQETQVQV
eukprot:1152050-Pelagomonas_calceolata.AAC.1